MHSVDAFSIIGSVFRRAWPAKQATDKLLGIAAAAAQLKRRRSAWTQWPNEDSNCAPRMALLKRSRASAFRRRSVSTNGRVRASRTSRTKSARSRFTAPTACRRYSLPWRRSTPSCITAPSGGVVRFTASMNPSFPSSKTVACSAARATAAVARWHPTLRLAEGFFAAALLFATTQASDAMTIYHQEDLLEELIQIFPGFRAVWDEGNEDEEFRSSSLHSV